MSWPQFTPQFLGESAQTTLLNVIKVVNATLRQLNTIFTYLTQKQQLDSVLLRQVSLKQGLNQVPHTLGKALTGWTPTRIRGVAVTLYDEQDSNPTPTAYLYIVSSDAVTVDLIVF